VTREVGRAHFDLDFAAAYKVDVRPVRRSNLGDMRYVLTQFVTPRVALAAIDIGTTIRDATEMMWSDLRSN
jgi:hypothetical protein